MKIKIMLFCGLCLLSLLSMVSFAAEDDSVIIIEEEDGTDVVTDGGGSDYWTKHFSGLLFATYSGFIDEDNVRWNTQARLRYDEDWNWGKFALEGRAYRSLAKFAFESRTIGTGETKTFTREVEADDVELLEGYVDLDFDYALFSFGRKRIVFGQFDLISPVDIVLPIDFSSTTLSYSKVDNRLPQYVAAAQFFIPGGLEIHYYYFPQLLTDQLLTGFTGDQVYTDEEEAERTAKLTTPADSSQQAVRLLYVGSRVIVGLTYFEGYEFPVSRARFLRRGDSYVCRDEDPETTTILMAATIDGCIGDSQFPVSEPDPTFGAVSTYGFELAIPVNRYSIKFEWARNLVSADIDAAAGGLLLPYTSGNTEAIKAYLRWVANENGDKEYVDLTRDIYNVGFDYYSDKWITNFNFLCVGYSFDKKSQRGYDLFLEATGNDNEEYRDMCFPALHIARNTGAQLRGRIGWALGTVGFAQGTTLYYQHRSNGGLTSAVSLDVLQYLNDSNVAAEVEEEEEAGGTTDVQRLSAFAASLRVSLGYRF